LEKWRLVRDTFNQKGLKKTLLEAMFWNLPGTDRLAINVDGQVIQVEVLAELPGAAFLQLDAPSKGGTGWFKLVDRELAKRYPERLIRFTHPNGDSWFWPKKLASGSLSFEHLQTGPNQLPDYLAQRLAGLAFSQKDHVTLGAINPVAVRERIRGQFETSKVTSDFFRKFKEKHEALTEQISGIATESETASYATLLLNRLMFIYFLQKKEFLNGDPDYLKSCLSQVQQLKGQDRFYSFYKDYLLELFFNKLDNPSGIIADPVIQEIAGDVPYVNGGVFSKSRVEAASNINIPDSAFDEIFTFFDSYTWHLDTRPTGTANEINPEVIGYIFEQYINYTADGKKENGAYYTKQDVTGYMVGQTLVPRILDELIDLGISPFQILKDSPLAYIHESLQHGGDVIDNTIVWKPVAEELFACWTNDPVHWSLLDQTETDPEVCLPDETWVEMFDRRERIEKLTETIVAGEVREVNDLITLNLSSQKLLLDVVGQVQDSTTLETMWDRVSLLSVIDPTCGSGAFLFSALEVLEVFYAAVLDKLEELNPNSRVVIVKNSHPNRRYFLRKHAALRNIYGTDIMADAIETAKLRIFLALASCLETKAQLEPLPDLDFNLKAGNLVVGFVNSGDVARVQNERLIVENRIGEMESSMSDHLVLYDKFLEASANNSSELQVTKSRLMQSEQALRLSANDYYAECVGKSSDEFSSWSKDVLPFHWSIEFPAVFSRGGFDVVIGNPPYIRSSKVPAATKNAMIGFATRNLPDFYAVCLERTDAIKSPAGRKAMIVMLSLSFSSGFQKIRDLIFSELSSSAWLSTFGIYPSSLFTGVRVRNSIVVQGPGANHFGTGHNIFSQAKRGWMFEGLEYSLLSLHDGIPVRSGRSRIFEGVRNTVTTTLANRHEDQLFMRPTGQYWIPVLPFHPPIFSERIDVLSQRDHGIEPFALLEGEDKNITLALTASKVGFLWWSATGDDFHVDPRFTEIPRSLVRAKQISPELRAMADEVEKRSHEHILLSANAGSVYVNIRWLDLNVLLDKFARKLLEDLGMLTEWRNLAIWYRKTMRATRGSTSSMTLSDDQRERISRLISSSKNSSQRM
jgi:hypothetical protein